MSVIAKKYYAIRVGMNTGVFETWEECKANVEGYPGALYKSFKTLPEAYEYLGIHGTQLSVFDTLADDFSKETLSEKLLPKCEPTSSEHALPFSDENHAIAYVDGSYNITTKVFGYGIVMFHNGKEYHLSQSYANPEMAVMRNVAGEIYGSMAAMEYAVLHNISHLTIYYDYMGISKWCTGEWKANKEGTIAYKKYYEKVRKKVNIKFQKVKGHSGDQYNDLADSLAKKACGID